MMYTVKIFLVLLVLNTIVWGMDLTSWKKHYNHGNDVWIQLHDKPGNKEDWIGIYHKGDTVAWENVIDWRWANNNSPTQVDPGYWYKFNLKDGNYEARFFLNNSYKVEKRVAFTVGTQELRQSNICNDEKVNNKKPCSVSTFHNISIYWKSDDIDNVDVSYRVAGAHKWFKAQALIYRPIKSQFSYEKTGISVKHNDKMDKANYRGSIVNLMPGTTYEVKVNNDENTMIQASTLKETFKIKKTYKVSDKNQAAQIGFEEGKTLVINFCGSKKDGYIVIDGKRKDGSKTELNVNNKKKYNIDIGTNSYVIIRNFVLKGANKHAIFMGKDAHHIVIEDCEISEWGSMFKKGDKKYAIDSDSAIYAEANLYASVIQRNKLFNPNFSANSWAYNYYSGLNRDPDRHPHGAQGITLMYCKKGNNVIRYNEVYTTNSKYFNDAIGGSANWSHYGFPGADSDVYGNYVANAYDDALEIDGGGQNVRVWNNFMEKTYGGISDTAVTVGPLYIWKNISGKSKLVRQDECVYQYRGGFLKMGGLKVYLDGNYTKIKDSKNAVYHLNAELMKGIIYLYNNTILSNGYGGIGTAEHCDGTFSNRSMRNIITRNNILDVPNKANPISIGHKEFIESTVNYAYDMVKSNNDYNGTNAIEASPEYEDDTTLASSRVGNFRLEAGSRGVKEGECLENIIPIKNPDVGAQQRSENKMVFGVNAKFVAPNINACK